MLVSYLAHADATNDTGTRLASSLDNGRTWTAADDRNPFPDEQSFYLSRLRNGDLLAVSYHTFMVEDSGDEQAEVPTAISHDGGRTWTHRAGRMTAPQAMKPISDVSSRPGTRLGGFVLVHRVIEDDDGTLYQSGYGFLAGDTKFRQILLASTDGGLDWTIRGTVAQRVRQRRRRVLLRGRVHPGRRRVPAHRDAHRQLSAAAAVPVHRRRRHLERAGADQGRTGPACPSAVSFPI